jgi:hypothetical protein
MPSSWSTSQAGTAATQSATIRRRRSTSGRRRARWFQRTACPEHNDMKHIRLIIVALQALVTRTRGYVIALLAVSVTPALYSGCSIPVMHLEHTASIDTTYARLGTLRVDIFDDRRPPDEKEGGKIAVNSLSGQVWSGQTDPGMTAQFRSVILAEMERTNLFTISDSPEYVLSGEVMSMKVERRATIVRYLSLVPLLGAIAAGDSEHKSLFWIGLMGSLVVGALEFPELTATVQYHVLLMRSDTPVFEKDVLITKQKRYWGYSEFGSGSVSDRASVLLDETVTESLVELFRDLERNAHGMEGDMRGVM